ncbi:MAG: M15 family metallopeptidase [Acidaminococcaceae bacterium]
MIFRVFMIVLCTLLFQVSSLVYANGIQPKDCPLDEKYLLGLYAGNGEQFLVREQSGRLNIVYRYLPDDKDYQKSNIFPLVKERYDVYQIAETGALTNTEASVKFERDKDGHGISCIIGGNRYTRVFFGPEKGNYFKIKTTKPLDDLRQEIQNAVMPVQTSPNVAQLVNLAAITGLKFDLRYATDENCFSTPLYESSKAYLNKNAADALGRVSEKLSDYGFGIVIWDAYRPWKVSKLAYEALPKEHKSLLPLPDKGSSHNTGNAVDVSLYNLKTGEVIQMISDFDEPSPRQYGDFAGGTSLERWERDLLQQIMSTEGFTCSDMEWWHFEFDSTNSYQLMDIPFSVLP